MAEIIHVRFILLAGGTLALLAASAMGNCAFGEDSSSLFIAASHTIYRVRTATKGRGL
jgi:hypothetical protein